MSASINVEIDGIEVEVTFKEVRHMYIRIKYPLGAVHMTVPYGTSTIEIRRVLIKKTRWILKSRERIALSGLHSPPADKTSEGLYLWGKEYSVQFSHQEKRTSIEKDEAMITVTASNQQQCMTLLRRWCLEQLRYEIERFIDHWSLTLGVVVESYQVRKMKRRWGSCYWNRSRIIINQSLLHGRRELLEYVIVHEMLHLIEHRHSKVFYDRMQELFPHWRELDTALVHLAKSL
ncbi:SprT family zinc-dependent metalloprotease [Entomospira entomophila]|uniref:M48 family metallopeptidase n=1 Tax=Entomospira entomophila TaxID=2719988 RepID=A0A968G9C4_9SPIO|nr:SprT family zinc-dependent metalloprotease [Entomospira entomophilus]NIZ40970.1 M48 family metallopeptidase [Entomospira entomophilus]WDI35183.1 SprT family zinc-dependent metalloprotease [Entomospira entomophilus]